MGARLIVQVVMVQEGKRSHKLEGRLAMMVTWLVRRAERVTAPDNIQVTFNCAGSRVSAEVKERESVDAAFLR